MTDANAPVIPAESSTAVMEVPTGGADYAEWRQTGKLPEKKPAASAKEAQPKPDAPAASHEESEPGKPRKRSDAADRLNELLADLKTAGLTPAELKTFRREAKAAEASPADKPNATPETTDKPADNGRPKRPRMDDPQYKTVEDYEKALEKYEDELSDWKVEQKLKQRDAENAQREMHKSLQERIASARQRYGEAADGTIKTAAQAIFNDKEVPGAVKALVDQSPVLVDLMYVIGSKPEDMASLVALSKSDPGAAIRKLVLLEQLVTEELKKPAADQSDKSEETPGRDTSGKFTKEKPQDSAAPEPPKEVSGRGATPPDAADQAVKTLDFAAHRRIQNQKDLARRQGR